MESLKIDKVNSWTITEQLRNILTYLSGELPALILKPSFYKNISGAIEADDKKLRQFVTLFTVIVSIVGEEKSEKFLTENIKKI